MDIYNSPHGYGTSPSAFFKAAGRANNEKLVTMSECATIPDSELIVRDNAYWLRLCGTGDWDYTAVNATTELSDAYTVIC